MRGGAGLFAAGSARHVVTFRKRNMNYRRRENMMVQVDEESSADRKKREKREMQKAQREIWLDCLPIVQKMIDAKTLGKA